jgi:hypothetical protein
MPWKAMSTGMRSSASFTDIGSLLAVGAIVAGGARRSARGSAAGTALHVITS